MRQRWGFAILALFAALLVAVPVEAQYSTITATTIADVGGAKLASGVFCSTLKNLYGQTGNIKLPGGGQATNTPVCRDVTAGVVMTTYKGVTLGALQLADAALTNPTYQCQKFVVTNNADGSVVLGSYGSFKSAYDCVQPTGATWSFDTFVPPGVPGVPGYTGGGTTNFSGLIGKLGMTQIPAGGSSATYLRGDGAWGASSGSGATATSGLTDWTNAGIASGYVPVWNSATSKWTPGAQTGTGGGAPTSAQVVAAVAGQDIAPRSVAAGTTVLDPVNGVTTPLVTTPKVTISGTPSAPTDAATVGYVTTHSGSGGTLTNVSLSMPNLLYSVSGSPCSITCVLALALLPQMAHAAVMGPTSGADAAPTVRLLVASDIPTLPKAQVGLGNVDNTSDANKPVSTAQATAIASASGATRPFVFPGAWNGTIPSGTYLNTFIVPTYATTALTITFPSGCTGSIFFSRTSSTASASYALNKNGTALCTATIAAGATTATWSGTGGSLTTGDRLEWLGGGDFTLAGISINAAGTQTGGVQ